jgi:hypothetical protein
MRFSLRITLLLAVALITCPSVLGQRLTDVKPDGVVKPRGWVIPNLRYFRDRERVPLMAVGVEGEHTLYATEIDLQGGGVLLWDAAYYQDEGGRRSLHESPISARSITRLDVDGKVFAYVTYGTGVAIQKWRRPRSESTFIFLGCDMGYAYYDLNGDGRFEMLARAERLRGANIFIPSWVLQDAKTAAR